MKKILVKIFMSAMLFTLVFSIAACSVDYTPVTPLASYAITVTGGSGSGVYNEGTSVTINATIAEDKNFDGWYEGETLISSDAAYTFTASKDVTYAAAFSEKYASLTITGGGYIQSTGAVSGAIEIGEEVTIATSAGSFDKTFECFLIGEKQVTTNPYTFTMGEEDVTITTIYSQTDKLYVYVDDGLLGGEEVTTATYCDKDDTVTISYQYPDEIYSYFDYWYYVDANGEEQILSYANPYVHTMTESIMIYTAYKNGYTVTAEDADITATNGSYFEIDNTGDDGTAIIYEDCSATITYSGTSVDGSGFIYWYTINEDLEEVFLSYDKEYTFVVEDDMEIFAKYGDDTTFEVAVTGGTIKGFANATEEILINREITVEATTGTGIFQGWTDGTTNADGTTNIVSYETSYTFTVTGTTAIEASYANKLVITDEVVLNDIFYYDQDENSALNDFSFLVGTTADVLSSTGVAGVKLYAYTAPDNDRSVPAAEITVTEVASGTALTNVYVDGVDGVSESYTMTADGYALEFSSDNGTKKLVTTESKTGLITFDGTAGSNFWTVLKAEAGDFGTSQKYYFAMELVGETGYANSDISSCGRIGAVEDLTQRANAATSTDLTKDTYTITDITDETNGSIEISGLSKTGETITVDATVATAGYEFFRVDITCNGVVTYELTSGNSYTFTMPNGDITVKASFKEEGTIMYPSEVTIVGGTENVTGKSTITVETGESITATASEDKTAGTIFQNWTDGSENIDGTAKILSYETDCTYTVMGDTILTTGYSNKLVISEDLDMDDLVYFDGNYLRFMRGTMSYATLGYWLPQTANVDSIKMYIYAGADDDRDKYLATVTVSDTKPSVGTVLENVYIADGESGTFYESYEITTSNRYLFEMEGADGTKVNMLTLTWGSFANTAVGFAYTFEGAETRDVWDAFEAVISGYSSTTPYYMAMQYIGDEGYEDSDISACSRIGMYQSTSFRTDTPLADDFVSQSPDYYKVNINGSTVNEQALEDEIITLDIPTKEGYTFTGFESTDVTIDETDGVYTFTMPANDIDITANYTQDVYTITNGTVSDYGTVTIDKTQANFGDTVTVTVDITDSNYILSNIYVVDNDNVEFTLQADGTYTFTMPSGNIEVKADIIQKIKSNITVNGGSITSHETDATIYESEEVTVTATAYDESTDSGSIFQGWTDGTTNADGTAVILSYETSYTFIADGDVTLSASYSNQLVIPEYASDPSEIYVYNGNYIEPLRYTEGNLFTGTGVSTVRLYIYADPDDDRDDYLGYIEFGAFATSGASDCTLTVYGADGIASETTSSISYSQFGANIYLDGASKPNLYLALADVIDGYSATANYFLAIGLVAEDGYADSEISSCSRIAFTQSGTQTNTPIE